MAGSNVSPAAVAAPPAASGVDEAARRRRVRRTALVCALIATAFYVGFIAMMLVRGSR